MSKTDPVKEKVNIGGIKTYKYGLGPEDSLERESLLDLFNQGKLSVLEYQAATSSISTLVTMDCYQRYFRRFDEKFDMPTNYTPRGYIRHGEKLINLKQKRDEAIKFAKQRVKCPFVVVCDSDGRVQSVRKSEL